MKTNATLDLVSPTATTRVYLSPVEVANYLGMKLATVYAWNSVGTSPPSSKLGKHVRYLLMDVDAWMDAKKSA